MTDTASAAPAAFEPRVVAFLCNWCAYAGADKAGAAQLELPANVRVVRLMCSGRMDMQLALEAFDRGADGVLVLGCHPGDCHYKGQNLRTMQRHRLFLRLLAARGIAAERCQLDFVAASEGERLAEVLRRVVADVRAIGPLRRQPASDPHQQETSDVQ